MRAIDNYFLQKEEPVKSCLLFLRSYIIDYDKIITEEWKYGMPFYCYNGKMMCYLWTHKKLGLPYVGFVDGDRIDHPGLLAEKRAKMKIFLIDSSQDIDVLMLEDILRTATNLRK